MSERKGWAGLVRVAHPDAAGRIRLVGRKIYILPTRYGLVFATLLLALLIASINYANNPAFLLTFLLAGILFQAIFHTWRNLKGLELRWLESESVFAGETAAIRFLLSDAKRDHYSLQLGFPGQEPVATDVPAGREVRLEIPLRTRHRGILEPRRLILESRYPLGLLRAWSYLHTGATVLVWPRPVEDATASGAPNWKDALNGDHGVGSDDFNGYRNYHCGDPPGHIHWKALAAEKGLLTKLFGGDRMNRLWLDFAALAPLETEIRLSRLAGAIQQLSREPVHYGLRLPDLELVPDHGEAHRRRCLDALARFGSEPEREHERPDK